MENWNWPTLTNFSQSPPLSLGWLLDSPHHLDPKHGVPSLLSHLTAHWSVPEEILGKTVLTCTPWVLYSTLYTCTCGEHECVQHSSGASLHGQGLLCPKYCLLCSIVKITNSAREGVEAERKSNLILDVRLRGFPLSRNIYLLEWISLGWAGSEVTDILVLNTMQTVLSAHNTRVTPHQPHRSSCPPWHGGNFLETLVTSSPDIWIQFNQVFMTSDVHYQDIQ